MAIPTGWVNRTKDFLIQLLEDWLTYNTLTGTIYGELGPQLSGTVTEPVIYVLELDGFPRFSDDNMLNVGFRIVWKYTEIEWDEAVKQLTDTLYDMTDYIYRGVIYVDPIMTGVKPYWMAVDITPPDFLEIYNKQRGYLNNQVAIDVTLRIAVTRRGWEFPRDFVD